MKTYQPSGKCSPAGISLVIALSLAGAIALGGITHLVGRFIYLIILMPLAMGFGTAFFLKKGILLGKCRNYTLSLIVGGLAGVVTYGSMHLFDYAHFQKQIVDYMMTEIAVTDEGDPMTQEVAEAAFQLQMQETTGQTGFIGYLIYSAQEGISITNHGSNGVNIGEVGTWIYFAVECVLVIAFAAMGASASKEPFCENCDAWYDQEPLVRSSHDSSDEILESLKQERFAELPTKINFPENHPVVQLDGAVCKHCNESDAVVSIQEITLDRKGNESSKTIHSQMIPMNDFRGILAGVEAAKNEEATQLAEIEKTLETESVSA